MNPLCGPNNVTQGHLLKMEQLFDDGTDVGSPDKAEHAILKMILGVFLPIQATSEVGELLCDVKTTS